jgi:hypothetical protein
MSAGRLKDTHIIIAAGALMVLLTVAAAMIGPADAPASYGASSLSAGAAGGKAAFLTLKALGHRVERSYEPMTAIAAEPSRTTLVITGAERPSELDRQALERFLKAGGSVLLVGGQGAAFLGMEGTPSASPFGEPRTYPAAGLSPLAAGVPEITMTPPVAAPKFGPSYVHVFSDGPDAPIVATTRIGSGRATWLSADTPITNAQIASAANLQLLLNVVGEPGGREVLWDEHYHGHRRSLWSYAARTPLPWMGAQLTLVMVAVFATYSRRRGPMRALASDQRTSPLEFIDMLRALYQRAGAASAAVEAARARLRRSVAAAYGIPADGSDDLMARTIAVKTGADPSEIRRLLDASAQSGSREVPSAEALALTRALQNVSGSITSGTRPRG